MTTNLAILDGIVQELKTFEESRVISEHPTVASSVLSSLQEEQKRLILDVLRKVNKASQSMKTRLKHRKTGPVRRSSKEDDMEAIIARIRILADKPISEQAVYHLYMDFVSNLGKVEGDGQELDDALSRVNSSIRASKALTLLAYVQQGYLFSRICQDGGDKLEVAMRCGVHYSTMYRRIKFSAFVDEYPRLLDSGLDYMLLIRYQTAITNFLKRNKDVGDKLSMSAGLKFCIGDRNLVNSTAPERGDFEIIGLDKEQEQDASANMCDFAQMDLHGTNLGNILTCGDDVPEEFLPLAEGENSPVRRQLQRMVVH